MASQKIVPIVEKLQLLSRPTFVNGRWRKPELSARRVAMVRQTMLSQNVYWPDKPLRNLGADKPLKLSRHEREREARQKKIEENMRKMPKMIQEYREKVYELREKTRKKKGRTEEELYLIATGKMKQQGPHWQIFKEGETSKKDAPNRDAARRDAKKDSSKK